LGIFVFLILKMPILAEIQETKKLSGTDYPIKTKIEEGVRREIKERFEDFLHRVLSGLRKIILKIEKTVADWLSMLKKKKEKDDKK